jgi:RNA polymerase sigma-70 factor (family 1)
MTKPLNLLSDQELLDKCKLNDERAFNILFDRYFKRLYSFGYGLIKEEEIAKEIAMDVMLRLWQKKGELVVENELQPYLFRSIKNAIYNYWRKAKIITEPLEIFEDNLSHSSPSADSNLTFKELEKSYADYLNNLPEQRRKIFDLSRNENMSYAEIAEKLNLSVHTVRNQMSSSVKYFRKHFGDIPKILLLIYLKS